MLQLLVENVRHLTLSEFNAVTGYTIFFFVRRSKFAYVNRPNQTYTAFVQNESVLIHLENHLIQIVNQKTLIWCTYPSQDVSKPGKWKIGQINKTRS